MIKKVFIKDYFKETGYDWEKDLKDLSTICHFTKTRVDSKRAEGELTFGHEQTFLLKSIAHNIKAKSFFEIGTGRGTACYATSLEPTMEKIVTVDILSLYDKMSTAIGYKPATASNYDIFQMIPFEQKEKISFKHRSELTYILDDLEDEQFELAFIDGEHDDISIIKEDYEICKKVVKPGCPIIFDDYHPEKFSVKKVVDEIIENDPSLEATLFIFSGHLFDESRKAEDYGVVMLK